MFKLNQTQHKIEVGGNAIELLFLEDFKNKMDIAKSSGNNLVMPASSGNTMLIMCALADMGYKGFDISADKRYIIIARYGSVK